MNTDKPTNGGYPNNDLTHCGQFDRDPADDPTTVIVGHNMTSEQAACYLMAHWLLTDHKRKPLLFVSATGSEPGIQDVREVLIQLTHGPDPDGDDGPCPTCGFTGGLD